MGLYNLINSDVAAAGAEKAFNKSLIVGFAVGLDGAAATLSLSLMGYTEFYVPLLITVMHLITIVLGTHLSESRLFCGMKNLKAAAPVLLIGLGAYKLISVFL